MEMKNKEMRSFVCDVEMREDTKHGTVLEGMPIVFGQSTDLGMWEEVIDREALKNTDLKDVRFLVNHDTSMIPLARSRNNNENSTMQMVVGEEGMKIRVDLDVENNPKAQELYSAVKRQDVSGMSFMFTVDEDKWEDVESEHPKRTITKIGKIFELSAVTFPAYQQTSINARSLDNGLASLENEKTRLENLRKTEELRSNLKDRLSKLSEKEVSND